MSKSIFRRVKDMVTGLTSGSTTLTFNMGIPSFFSQTYRTYVLEGYARNPTLFACLDLIARGVGDLKWCLYDKPEDDPDRQPIRNHPLLDLLRKPDPRYSKAEWMARSIINLYLEGDAFHYINAPTIGRKRYPKELNILRPDRVFITPEMFADTNQPTGDFKYRYVNMFGIETTYTPDQILHHQFYNPLDDYNGLSPLAALSHSVDLSNSGRRWNYSLLKNAIVLSSWFQVEGNLDESQQAAIKQTISDKYAGADNAGKPMLLEAGMEYKMGSWSPRDMDWVQGINMADEDIMRALHVPPEILGKTESRTYANFEHARKVFYGDVILPVGRKLRDLFNLQLAPLFGDNLYLDIDENKITALQEATDLKHDRVRNDYAAGLITLDEARIEIGLEELDPTEMGELYIQPSGGVDDPDELDEADPNDQIDLENPEDEQDVSNPNDGGKGKSISPEAKSRRRQRYEVVAEYRKRFEHYITDQVKQQFQSEQERLNLLILKSNTQTVIHEVDDLVKRSFEGEWATLLSQIYVRVVKTIGDQELTALRTSLGKAAVKAKPTFDPYSDAIKRQIAEVVSKGVHDINKTTMKRITDKISEGIAEGKSTLELASIVNDLYKDSMTVGRAETIGRTIAISSTNFAGQQVAKQSEIPLKKEWITTIDGRERKAHEHMDGKLQDISKPWSVDGEQMMFPGDVSLGASAGNTINCRCAEGYVPADES